MKSSAIRRARVLIGAGVGVEAGERGAPAADERRARRRLARAQRLARPFGIGLVEQRQVEQPFAGIVDEIERQSCELRAAPAGGALELDASAATAKCAASIAASGDPGRQGWPDDPRRRSAARRRPAAARAARA